MDQLEREIQRGQSAADLLDNQVWRDTWTEYEAEIVDQLKRCPPRDAEGREKLVLMLQMFAKFQAMVTETVQTGKLAAETLRQKSLREKALGWIGRDGLTG